MPFVEPPPLPPFLARLLPFPRRAYRLESGADAGRAIHFLDAGDPAAPAVVLFHGNPTWSFLWRRVMALLPGLRLVAPDLLGLGLSDRPPRLADHTLVRHGAAIGELVAALGLERPVLVGQDWGGPIAVQVGLGLEAEADWGAGGSGAGGPASGLVLANTVVVPPEDWSRFRGTAFHRFARLPVVSDVVFRGLGFPMNTLRWVQGDRRSIAGEVARAYRWPLGTWRSRVAPLALARMVPDGPGHPTVPALAAGAEWARGFAGPVSLVWGLRDPILGRALGRHLRELPARRRPAHRGRPLPPGGGPGGPRRGDRRGGRRPGRRLRRGPSGRRRPPGRPRETLTTKRKLSR